MVQPSVVEEGEELIAISAFVENQKNEPLTGLTLTLDFVRSDPILPVIEFQTGNSWVLGVENINGFGVLNPRSAFEAHWIRSPLVPRERRLTSEAKFEVIFRVYIYIFFKYVILANHCSVLQSQWEVQRSETKSSLCDASTKENTSCDDFDPLGRGGEETFLHVDFDH